MLLEEHYDLNFLNLEAYFNLVVKSIIKFKLLLKAIKNLKMKLLGINTLKRLYHIGQTNL